MTYTTDHPIQHDFFLYAGQDTGESWTITNDDGTVYDFTGMSAVMNIKRRKSEDNVVTLYSGDFDNENGYIALDTGIMLILFKKELFEDLEEGDYIYEIVMTYPSNAMTRVWFHGKIEVSGSLSEI